MAYAQDTRFVYGALADLTKRVALGEDASTIPCAAPVPLHPVRAHRTRRPLGAHRAFGGAPR